MVEDHVLLVQASFNPKPAKFDISKLREVQLGRIRNRHGWTLKGFVAKGPYFQTPRRQAVRCVHDLMGQENFDELEGLVSKQLLKARGGDRLQGCTP